MTLNLDLQKFSKKELSHEIAKCSDNIKFLEQRKFAALSIYNKLLSKRFIRPVKLAEAKTAVDEFEISRKLVDGYSCLLLDESNRRGQLERDKSKENERN